MTRFQANKPAAQSGGIVLMFMLLFVISELAWVILSVQSSQRARPDPERD
jgi:hypothetical protein